MMKLYATIWALLLLSFNSRSQNYFNKLDTNIFLNTSCIQLPDSSYIFVGELWSIGNSRSVSLSYYFSDGMYFNNDTFNVYPILSEYGSIEKRDNNFLVSNIINYNPPFASNDRDIELSCFDYSGAELWSQEYGGFSQDSPTDILAIGNEIYLLGVTSSFGDMDGDFLLIKTDVDGNMIWQQTYGGSETEVGYAIFPTMDNNFIISGHTEVSSPDWDIYIIKIDPDGNILWERTYGSNSETDYGGQLTILSDHTLLVQRNVDDGTVTTAHIDKLDGNGDLIWSTSFSFGDMTFFSTGKPIENFDGTIVVVACAKNSQNVIEQHLIKLNPLGDTLWTKTYFTTTFVHQYFYDIKPTLDGGYVMCGSAFNADTVQCAWIVKTDCNGAEDVMYPTGAPCDYYDCTLYPINANFTSSTLLVDLAVDPTVTFTNSSSNTTSRVWNFGDGSIDYTEAVVNHTFTQTGTYEVSLIVFHGMCSDTMTQTIEVINSAGIQQNEAEPAKIKVFPNPANESVKISFNENYSLPYKIMIIDISGKEVSSNYYSTIGAEISTENLESGLYFVRVQFTEGTFTVAPLVVNHE